MEVHLSDGELVRYNDYIVQAKSRTAIREHLDECQQCSARLENVCLLIHPCVEELMDYHEGITRNPHTQTRVRAHIEEKMCPLCRGWLDDLKEAQEVADNPVLFDADTIIWEAQAEDEY